MNFTYKKCVLAAATGVSLLGLSVASANAGVVSHFGNSTDFAIPDHVYDGSLASMVGSSIDVGGGLGAIEDVTLSFTMSHTYFGDLTIKLESAEGTVLHLVSRPGFAEDADDNEDCCGNDGDLVNTTITLDDLALVSIEEIPQTSSIPDGTFSPFSSWGPFALSNLTGENPLGTWTLYVADAAGADTGTLEQWDLYLTTASTDVPEPASLALLGTGLLGLGLARRRRRSA